MAAIGGILGGGLMVVGGALAALLELRAFLRIAIIFRRVPTAVADLQLEAEVTLRGHVERALGEQIPALTPGPGLVWQQVIVQEFVGRRMHEPVNQVTGTRFILRDASGTVEIDATDAAGLSMPLIGGGRATAAVLDFAGDVFAWRDTIKNYFERGLRVGDEVTVSGSVENERNGLVVMRGRRQMQLVFGKPKLLATQEAKAIGWYLAMIPGGAAIAGLSYVVLQLATGRSVF